MTAKAWCERHVTSFDAATGCRDCGALAMEALADDMQPVHVEDAEHDEPYQFAWASMDGFWG